jgi:hypothetical protein
MACYRVNFYVFHRSFEDKIGFTRKKMKFDFLPCLISSEGHANFDPATNNAYQYFIVWVYVEPDEGPYK